MVDSSYDTNLNPLAWIGEWYAERNLLVDPGYTRISIDPPEDLFYGLIPWAYQLIWRQLVWTWEPVWSHRTVIKAMRMAADGHESVYVKQKQAIQNLFGFEANCPDVKERNHWKRKALNTMIPAWVAFGFAWLARLFLVLGAALHICILWVFDWVWWLWIVCRDWWYYAVHVPVWKGLMWLWGWILWIMGLPRAIFELTFRFLWGIQVLIMKIMWDIMYPVIWWCHFILMYLPRLVWTYIMVPYWWWIYK